MGWGESAGSDSVCRNDCRDQSGEDSACRKVCFKVSVSHLVGRRGWRKVSGTHSVDAGGGAKGGSESHFFKENENFFSSVARCSCCN